jgi:bifunctional DNA-binding transcriptional regulator/antitoxin component of YhaV-PrlF toxin-antitoxin module
VIKLPVFIVKNGRIVVEGEVLRKLGLKDGDMVIINDFITVKRGNMRFKLGFDASMEEIDELIAAGARA